MKYFEDEKDNFRQKEIQRLQSIIQLKEDRLLQLLPKEFQRRFQRIFIKEKKIILRKR